MMGVAFQKSRQFKGCLVDEDYSRSPPSGLACRVGRRDSS